MLMLLCYISGIKVLNRMKAIPSATIAICNSMQKDSKLLITATTFF